MGNYRIEVDAVGGHGCQREIGDGQEVKGCGLLSCPGCAARRFVADLRQSGQSLSKATFTHWPGESSEVVDDLITGKRKGRF